MARAIADVNARTIKQLAQADWQKSGLSDSHARKLHLRALSATQVKGLNSRFHEAGALHIPYWTLDGQPTRFYRIRYLEKLPGASGLAEKPQRYDQLPVLQEAYYPPFRNWRKIAEDPTLGICITEGEKKAACACANGIPMMALGGVYSFMSGKRAIDLLPSMKEIVWKDRQVYIVYDNDITHKPEVLKAQHALSQVLLAEGAKIKYVAIPPGKEKGVDDYLVKHGKAKFADLIDAAEPFLEGHALWQLSSEVVYIKEIDAVVERETHMVMDTDKFSRHVYGNRHYMQQIEKGSGKNKHVILEKAPLAKRWVEWEHRAELKRLIYEPGQDRIYNNSWNTWNGWGVIPKKGPVGPWTWMLDFLFKGDDRTRKYFEQWCAYPIIHPGAKLRTAVVLWSRVKWLGKSTMALTLSKIYGENSAFVDSKQLKGSFNTWARNRQLVVGEEIIAGKDKIDADYLKYIITHPTFTIHAKFKDEYQITNHTNFMFLSNNPDAVLLEDGDKRYLVHGIKHTTPAPKDKYDWYGKWMNGDGPAHLMYHLQHDVNMRGFDPYAPAPETTSKQEMILTGKTTAGFWVQRLQEDPVRALRPLGERVAEGCDLFTPEQLYHAFDPQDKHLARSGGAASLGKHLAGAGFRQVNGAIPMLTATGIHRLYAVRHQDKWEQVPRREIREHYDSFFSPKTAGEVK